MPRLVLHDLTLGYDGRPAVERLDGAFESGSLTAIVGPNGSGKSTLLKAIAGALRPLAGRIEREGFGARDVAYLPQQSEIDRSFPASVADLVGIGLWRRRGMLGRFRGEDRDRLDGAIAAVGLAGFRSRGVGELSGGEMQRALFARVLLRDAPLILLDEPFTAIDDRTVADLLRLVHRWRDERRTILAVLHDLDLVREIFPRTLLLAGRPIAWGETRTVLRTDNLAAARRLNGGLDHAGLWRERPAA